MKDEPEKGRIGWVLFILHFSSFSFNGAQSAKIDCGKTLKFADLLNDNDQETMIVALDKDVRSSAPIFRRSIFANRNRGGQTNG
jgi:hypothetical protein